jgi:hypothetical protein
VNPPPDPWAFGWDALVAIGTLTLALATAGLALLTRRVAKASAADLRSQWRPVILPGELGPNYDAGAQRQYVRIRNAGRGPALSVQTLLDPDGVGPSNWSLGAVAPGDEVRLAFDNVAQASERHVLLDYLDLSGRLYSTEMIIDHDGSRTYNVFVSEGRSLTARPHRVPRSRARRIDPEAH